MLALLKLGRRHSTKTTVTNHCDVVRSTTLMPLSSGVSSALGCLPAKVKQRAAWFKLNYSS
ncbi:hypothetical protein FD48_GL000287 [Lactiplantibacillus paraplantarum DSM 10667]|nr:hypothetical protein FD48_GL000287 [Lactiplantibacillus paraplantarum DSM 10667]